MALAYDLARRAIGDEALHRESQFVHSPEWWLLAWWQAAKDLLSQLEGVGKHEYDLWCWEVVSTSIRAPVQKPKARRHRSHFRFLILSRSPGPSLTDC